MCADGELRERAALRLYVSVAQATPAELKAALFAKIQEFAHDSGEFSIQLC